MGHPAERSKALFLNHPPQSSLGEGGRQNVAWRGEVGEVRKPDVDGTMGWVRLYWPDSAEDEESRTAGSAARMAIEQPGVG